MDQSVHRPDSDPGDARRAQSSPRLLRKVLVSLALMGIVVGLGLAAVWSLVRLRPRIESAPMANLGFMVETLEIRARDYRQILAGYGVVEALVSATLSSEVSGRVLEVGEAVRVGKSIEAGALICRIDDAAFRAELNRRQAALDQVTSDRERMRRELPNAEARIEVSREDLRLTEAEVQRQEALQLADIGAARNAVDAAQIALQTSKSRLLDSENRLINLTGDLDRTESLLRTRAAEVELARLDVDRCQIRAPFSGVVALRGIEPGEWASAGTALARIVDFSVVEIPIQTPASDAGDVSIASRVEIHLPQAQGQRWKGKVVRVSPEIDPLNRTVSLYVRVDNDALESPLLPGQLVEAGIQGRLYRETIVIPRRALIDEHAFVKVEDRAERRRLDIIRAIGDDLLIAGGLREGEELILTNLEVLYDGARVITSHEMNALLQVESADSPNAEALAKSAAPGPAQH